MLHCTLSYWRVLGSYALIICVLSCLIGSTRRPTVNIASLPRHQFSRCRHLIFVSAFTFEERLSFWRAYLRLSLYTAVFSTIRSLKCRLTASVLFRERLATKRMMSKPFGIIFTMRAGSPGPTRLPYVSFCRILVVHGLPTNIYLLCSLREWTSTVAPST